jgi:hypothetical protein
MPFQSLSQLRFCYARHPNGMNCNEWLRKTWDLCALPEHKNDLLSEQPKLKKKNLPKIVIGPVQTGARGGKYRIFSQGNCQRKVYVSKNTR